MLVPKTQFLTIFKPKFTRIYSNSLDSMAGTGGEQFEVFPKHGEGEANKEAKGSAKVGHQGLEGIDEVLFQDSRADGPIGDHNAKCVDVFMVDCLYRILMVGARH